jgi:hypothetical protein
MSNPLQERGCTFYRPRGRDSFACATVLWVGSGFPETLGGFVGEGTRTLNDATDVAFDVVGEGADGYVCFFKDCVF